MTNRVTVKQVHDPVYRVELELTEAAAYQLHALTGLITGESPDAEWIGDIYDQLDNELSYSKAHDYVVKARLETRTTHEPMLSFQIVKIGS